MLSWGINYAFKLEATGSWWLLPDCYAQLPVKELGIKTEIWMVGARFRRLCPRKQEECVLQVAHSVDFWERRKWWEMPLKWLLACMIP